MNKLLLSIALVLSSTRGFASVLVSLTPDNPFPALNSSFDVSVDISGALDAPHNIAGNTFSSFGFNVNVGNAGILHYDGFTLGSLFGFDFSGFGSDVAAGSTDPGGISATSFNLAVLHFTVVGVGNSALHILAANDPANNLGLAWTDLNDTGAAIDASTIIQTVDSIPEPATWLLALGGVFCVVMARRIARAAV